METKIIADMKVFLVKIGEFFSAISLSDIKDFFNIIFFITAGVIAILTYRQARKTVLQPIKTEVFKEQLKECTKVMDVFNGKGETELRSDFDFDNVFIFNVVFMFDAYVETVFNVKLDRDKRPYNESVGGIISQESASKYFVKVDGHLMDDKEKADEKEETKECKIDKWKKYDHVMIKFSQKFVDMNAVLDKFISNPLIPKDLMLLISDYQKKVRENLTILEAVIKESATSMPEKYPDLETLRKATTDWVQSEYNSRFIHLSEPASKISEYVRSYFKTDELMKSKF